MLLFVGLGNPGPRHAGNRHNIGFMAVQAIARRHDIKPWRRKFQGVAVEGVIGGERVLLLLPGTYMNESGRAVQEAARFYKLEAGQIVVFHDEVDLRPAKVRVKIGGGVAGHNGLRSITAHVGNDYKRVRIGIGKPDVKEQVPMHVLRRFRQERMALGGGAVRRHRRERGAIGRGQGFKFSEQGASCHVGQGLRRRRRTARRRRLT